MGALTDKHTCTNRHKSRRRTGMQSVQVSYAFVPLLITSAVQRAEHPEEWRMDATQVMAPFSLSLMNSQREWAPDSSFSLCYVCSEFIHQQVDKKQTWNWQAACWAQAGFCWLSQNITWMYKLCLLKSLNLANDALSCCLAKSLWFDVFIIYLKWLKVPREPFNRLWSSKFNTDASHLTYICKWDHGWKDWRLLSVFYNPLAQPALEIIRHSVLAFLQTSFSYHDKFWCCPDRKQHILSLCATTRTWNTQRS